MLEELKEVLNKIIEKYNKTDKKFHLTLNEERKDVFIIYHSRFKHILSIEVGCNEDENTFYVATSIGAGTGGSDYNRSIFERFKDHKEGTDIIAKFYKGCDFVSNIRLNTFKTNIWFTADKFTSLEDYLKMFNKIPVTNYRVPKQKCIDDLNARHAIGQFNRLQQYRYRFYHWLEFLTISETFDASPVVKGDFRSAGKILTKALQKHLNGMWLILKVRQIRNMKKKKKQS